MPEPERSIEELVEDLTVAAIGYGGCTKQECHQHEGELTAARDALRRAAARLREENERLRDALVNVRDLYGETVYEADNNPNMTLFLLRHRLTGWDELFAALAPKGGYRDR